MCFYYVSLTLESYVHQSDLYLDKSGMMTTAHGLRIACLGGMYDPNTYSSSDTAPVSIGCLYRPASQLTYVL